MAGQPVAGQPGYRRRQLGQQMTGPAPRFSAGCAGLYDLATTVGLVRGAL